MSPAPDDDSSRVRREGSRASFRDPDGSVFLTSGRILRNVYAKAAPALRSAIESPGVRALVAEGRIIESRVLPEHERSEVRAALELEGDGPAGSLLLEHPRVSFPSFPYEWCPEMLHAAGKLTLDIAAALHKSGLGLKDATPYNVLFRGPKPIFIDAASLERRDPADPTWVPYAQFVRMFVLPLLLNKHCKIPLAQVFLANRDGVEPQSAYGILGMGRRLMPAFFFTVTVPTWLAPRAGRSPDIYSRRLEAPDKAAFVLASTLRQLGRQLGSARPDATTSDWSGYMDTKTYRSDDFRAKEQFVLAALDRSAAKSVLDVGCNTGHFSAVAAERGARVVALDSDQVCVGQTYRRAVSASLDILPLVGDIARPSPAVGWRNEEQASLLDRLAGQFDLVLMLAVLHHLLVTERIPLVEILGLAAELTKDLIVLEYVGPSDPMFQRLVRGRSDLYSHVTIEWFETACRERFAVIDSRPLETLDRRLYLLKKVR